MTEKNDAIIPWRELVADDKIERMRQVIKAQQNRIDYLQDSVYALQNQMRHHIHVNDSVCISIEHPGLVTASGRLKGCEDYF